MLIKIDCREKELLALLTPATATATATAAPPPAPAPAEPDFYLMDLGDGMTMKVPLPKKSLGGASAKKRKVTASVASTVHEIKSERLPLGDIILHDPVSHKDILLFERKTLNDLAASIQDGRYKEQSFRLSQEAASPASGLATTHNIVYIIEGDLNHYDDRHSRITKTALQSAMVSLLYYKGFSVVRTINVGETADFIVHFADKVAKEGLAESTAASVSVSVAASATGYSEVAAAAKKEKRDYITRENIGEIMLAQVPGVSAKIASAILSKYSGSLFEFLGDLHRKINDYEESLSPELSPPSPAPTPVPAPMNKNKLKHVSECFTDIAMDGKRGIGKATIEKLCYFLS
jgi:ERCC4-type nuclease